MYKAIREVGGYKVGDEVPADKAEAWLKMYAVPHVEKVGKGDKASTEDKSEPPKEESSGNVMLDDYLSRNTNVVKKNIEGDDLSQEQLENLLVLEESGKKRKVVINAIKHKLK